MSLRALPKVYTVPPSPSCERQLATFHDGSKPTRRPIIVPPRPGLRAVAVGKRTTRLEWWFRELPGDCRPAVVILAVDNGSDPSALPTVREVTVNAVTGAFEITYPDFLPPPNVAHAIAATADGLRSRTGFVLIKRLG